MKNTRKRLHRSLRHHIRENFEEQALLDIEAQLSGEAVKEENEDKFSLEDNMHPLQLHLAQSLLSYPVSNSLEDEWHRRVTGTAAVVQCCDVLEGGPLRGRPKRKAPESASPTGPISQPKVLQQTGSESTHARYLPLYMASGYMPPGNTSKLLSSQRHAFKASQVRGFRISFAFRCFMILGVLRATLMLFILRTTQMQLV